MKPKDECSSRNWLSKVSNLTLLSIWCLAAGCSTIKGYIREPEPNSPTGELQAGAAKCDITPPPGFPMGGHSIAGTVGRGYWTRLYTRAIYLEDKKGRGLVLVSSDLWSISAGLSDRVAELVRNSSEGRHLSRGQIMLSATHTHQSPGNFSSSPFYNGHASCMSGFDPGLFNFLATRIAVNIINAIREKQPAVVFLSQNNLPSVARNRSMEAFLLDPESRKIIADNALLPVGAVWPLYPNPDAYRAVDPAIHVLRIESRGEPGNIIAMAGFLAAHPTVMSHKTQVYSGDTFSVAAIRAEQGLAAMGSNGSPSSVQKTTKHPVVALFNGAEGDISPNWTEQDRKNTLAVGERIAAGLQAWTSGGLPMDGQIDFYFQKIQLAGRSFEYGGKLRQTDTLPIPGAGQLGGAEDARSFLFNLGWKEGVTSWWWRTTKQGAKQPGLDPVFLPIPSALSLTRLVCKLTPAPTKMPLAVYQFGNLVIATIPFEATTVMGRRIERSVLDALPSNTNLHVMVVGLANEYISYLATPEEYNSQQYEGASTLYGPASADLVVDELHKLALELRIPKDFQPVCYRYNAGSKERFGLSNVGGRPAHPEAGLENLVQNLSDGKPMQTVDVGSGSAVVRVNNRQYPRFDWLDRIHDLRIHQRPETRVTPRVAIEFLDSEGQWQSFQVAGVSEDDQGLDLVTVAVKVKPSKAKWSCIWLPPSGATSKTLRFRVEDLGGHVLWSNGFILAH